MCRKQQLRLIVCLESQSCPELHLDRGNCGVMAGCSVHVFLDLGMTLFFPCYANTSFVSTRMLGLAFVIHPE